MANVNTFIRACLLSGIRVYRFAFSQLWACGCRFEPSCSSYAMEAINVHGCWKGCFLAIKRILCCHPWHAGGIDPVPLPKKPLN